MEVQKGDVVAIYLPMIPETAIAMLACARIGAVHNVIFSGFSAEAVRERVIDSEAKVIITADGGRRKGRIVPLKRTIDLALKGKPSSVEKVIVINHVHKKESMLEGRDYWYDELSKTVDDVCPPE